MYVSVWIFAVALLGSLAGCVSPSKVSATSQPGTKVTTAGARANGPQVRSQLQGFALVKNNLQGLQRYARNITVKVISEDNWGSGILVRRQGSSYTVLTNQHVLWIGNNFTIQTPDGRSYAAQRDATTGFGKNDLGMLHFTSSPSTVYPIANLGCSLRLPSGTPVFAAGFPLPLTEQSTKGFKFTSGSISLISKKAFEGGYQVGYSNTIEKGMSGGPVLNTKGEVIAVNGMHQEPLWGDPYIYQDGSKPTIGFNILSHSSWAIPIETVVRSAILRTDQNSSQCLSAQSLSIKK
jgi:S1-C subfamily serine protease